MAFGVLLRRRRLARGMTQAEHSEASGVPLGSVRNYETERRDPALSAVERLARALGAAEANSEAWADMARAMVQVLLRVPDPRPVVAADILVRHFEASAPVAECTTPHGPSRCTKCGDTGYLIAALAPPAMLTRNQAARFRNLGVTMWDTHAAAGLTPAPVRVGAKVLYCRAELDAWCEHGMPPRGEWSNPPNRRPPASPPPRSRSVPWSSAGYSPCSTSTPPSATCTGRESPATPRRWRGPSFNWNSRPTPTPRPAPTPPPCSR